MAVIPGQAVTAYPLPDEELSPTSKNAVSNEAVCEGLNEIKNTLNHKADLIYDTASGDIATFPDGADGLPVKDLTVAIEPVQSGTGDPSPTNVRPISGWTGCNISHSGADTSDPTVIPISWQSEAGTVYGGTLDVTSGVLTVDRKYISLSGFVWISNRTGPNNYECYVSVTDKKVGIANVISDKLKTAEFDYNLDYAIRGFQNDNAIAVRVPITVASDPTEMKQWVNSNDIHVCYELATPLAVQLDPVAVTTLLGQNNIFADCGPSTVEYPCDTKLYIQKINTPTDDDMVADANIASGKYFIVNNNLYLSTAAILAGDPIKPGTNCTLTNLAAALNALNS